MTVVIKSDLAYAGSSDLSTIEQVSRSAQDIYDAYAARVVADGGTVGDSTACLAAITAAIAGGYFYRSAIAVSPRWGRKLSGSAITKLYNLVDSAIDGVVTNTVDLDAASHAAWDTALFNVDADVLTFTGVTVNRQGTMGFVGSTVDHSTTSNGITVRMTPVSQQWIWGDSAAGSMTIAGTTKIACSPDFAPAGNDAIGLLVEQGLGRFSVLQNGLLRKQATSSFTALADAATATVTILRNASNVYLTEAWYLHDATYNALEACCYDVGARY